MSLASTPRSAAGDEEGALVARAAVLRIKDHLSRDPSSPSLRVAVEGDADDLVLLRHAVELLARVLVRMAAGEGVSIVPRRPSSRRRRLPTCSSSEIPP